MNSNKNRKISNDKESYNFLACNSVADYTLKSEFVKRDTKKSKSDNAGIKKSQDKCENLPAVRSIHSEKIFSPNDRLTKIIFGEDNDLSLNDLSGAEIVPVRTDKRGKLSINVRINFERLEQIQEISLPQSLNNPFARAVHDAVLSLFLAGNTHFTAEKVFCTLGGNKRQNKNYSNELIKEIARVIERLSLGRVYIDATNEAKAKGYNFKRTEFFDYLIPLRGFGIVDMNGQHVWAYEFSGEPVLYSYAKQKGQIITADIDMLALPNKFNMTRENIILQRYLLERIEGMKNDKNKLGCVIKYETIFEVLGAQELSKVERKRIRDKVKIFLDNWVELAYIKGYKEESRGRLIYSVRIELYEHEKKKFKG